MYQGSLTVEKRRDRDYEVEFKNVSFKYPGSDSWALRNVNMKFKVGGRLAVVGRNGSGKTTFIKLLCRLYDPTEGEILLNGINIRKYNYLDYLMIFSVVFQDFKILSGMEAYLVDDVEEIVKYVMKNYTKIDSEGIFNIYYNVVVITFVRIKHLFLEKWELYEIVKA